MGVSEHSNAHRRNVDNWPADGNQPGELTPRPPYRSHSGSISVIHGT